MKRIELFTDGACSGNPGVGGWGALLRFNGVEKELSGGEAETTNNRMELQAVISGLEALKEPCEIEITTDSQYVKNGMTQWIDGWQRKNWMRGNKPVKNSDLWKALLAASEDHEITWQWVRGHSGHRENEICDRLATDWVKAYKAKG